MQKEAASDGGFFCGFHWLPALGKCATAGFHSCLAQA
jgi:hypothetical protein